MKAMALLKIALMAVTGSMLLGGCVYRERVVYREPGSGAVEGEVIVTEAPPPPIVEEVAIAPGPGFIWVGGCWIWHGHWVWSHGRWARPPHRGAVWMAPRYVYRGGAHVWIRGGWR